MLNYYDIPKNIKINNSLESLNGRIKKIAGYKSNVSWLQYLDIILNLEKEYKDKIINLESVNKINLEENKIKKKNINLNNIKKSNKFFFKWKSYSCRFDSILFILYFKLIGILKNMSSKNPNNNINNLYSYCEEVSKFNKKDFHKGFFDSYNCLKDDYFNIKNKLETLKQDDNNI